MSADIDLVQLLRLSLSIFLPSLAGYEWATWFRLSQAQRAASLAHGFLLGQGLVLISLMLFDVLGVSFSYGLICSLLVVYYLLARALNVRSVFKETSKNAENPAPGPKAWELAVTALLAVLILTQISTLFIEVINRPTFPWDAWRGWEPKAIQFFTNKALDAPVITIGNFGVLSVGAQTWIMLALDQAKSPLTHLPWFFVYVAIGLAVYSFVADFVSKLAGFAAAAFTLTLPMLSTHAALAGYADIWLCLAFTLAVFTAIETGTQSSLRGIVLCAIYVGLAMLTKRAGIGFGLITIILLIISHSRGPAPFPRPVIFGTLVVTILVSGGVAWSVVSFSQDGVVRIPGAAYEVTITPQLTPYVEALFLFSSWNLLWYGVGVAAMTKTLRCRRSRVLSQLELALLASFLYAYAYFTILSPVSATNHTGLSRALLPLASISVAFCVLVLTKQSIQKEDKYPDIAMRGTRDSRTR